jgi:hypothetical protein
MRKVNQHSFSDPRDRSEEDRRSMVDKIVSVKQLTAVRLIRAGSATDQVCRDLRLPPDRIRSLEIACRNVPDYFLAQLEQTLAANVKLRRLIAGLGESVSEMARTDSD